MLRRGGKTQKNCTKKGPNDQDNHDVVTQLESDILECEVKWALGSITMNTASGGDELPTELFQILKDGAVIVLYLICQQIWKTGMATGLKKVSFHSNPKEGQCQRMFKLPYSCAHFTLAWLGSKSFELYFNST